MVKCEREVVDKSSPKLDSRTLGSLVPFTYALRMSRGDPREKEKKDKRSKQVRDGKGRTPKKVQIACTICVSGHRYVGKERRRGVRYAREIFP